MTNFKDVINTASCGKIQLTDEQSEVLETLVRQYHTELEVSVGWGQALKSAAIREGLDISTAERFASVARYVDVVHQWAKGSSHDN